ncbi:hypothetical protein AAW01_04335 [Aurantiacibacter gangjinensis]|uniref:Uncharacterized protein n=1 Tax=Aurantiacibacter gangjinensis TaxID=502682 RepID=A0A0G9MR65_9SPHN|nr:hypothetical protein AAW01_04335 [Aurantiacibacter gangjinensis]
MASTSTSDRAKWWSDFLLDHVDYPAPARLALQLDGARFKVSCPCHCNAYRVEPGRDAVPLVVPLDSSDQHSPFLIFNANIPLSDGRYLDLDLLADSQGNLFELVIECCANSYPVPDEVEIGEGPIRTTVYGKLLKDPE